MQWHTEIFRIRKINHYINCLITTNKKFGKSITCEHDALISCICSLCKQDLHVTAYKYLLLNLKWVQSIAQEDFCNTSYALHSTSHKVSAGGLQSINTSTSFKGEAESYICAGRPYSVNWEEEHSAHQVLILKCPNFPLLIMHRVQVLETRPKAVDTWQI